MDTANNKLYKRVSPLTKSQINYFDTFITLDFETTGLSCWRDKIIEIACIKYEKGKRVSEFNTLINPLVPVSRTVTEITGINNKMLVDAPLFDHISDDFFDFIAGHTLVIHNASFDMGFLNSYANARGIELTNPVCCTLILARKLFPELENRKLETVARHLGIIVQHHRALGDCIAAAGILLYALNGEQLDLLAMDL